MSEHGRQGSGGKLLQLGILAGSNLPDQQRYRLLMLHHLRAYVVQIESLAVRTLQSGAYVHMMRIELLGQRNVIPRRKAGQGFVGIGMIADHAGSKVLYRRSACHVPRQFSQFDLCQTAFRQEPGEQYVGRIGLLGGGHAPLLKNSVRRHEGWIADLRMSRSEEHTSELQSRENTVCRL